MTLPQGFPAAFLCIERCLSIFQANTSLLSDLQQDKSALENGCETRTTSKCKLIYYAIYRSAASVDTINQPRLLIRSLSHRLVRG